MIVSGISGIISHSLLDTCIHPASAITKTHRIEFRALPLLSCLISCLLTSVYVLCNIEPSAMHSTLNFAAATMAAGRTSTQSARMSNDGANKKGACAFHGFYVHLAECIDCVCGGYYHPNI